MMQMQTTFKSKSLIIIIFLFLSLIEFPKKIKAQNIENNNILNDETDTQDDLISKFDINLVPFNNSKNLFKMYEKSKCNDLLKEYENYPERYKVFSFKENSTEAKLEKFFINSTNIEEAIKQYIASLLGHKKLVHVKIELVTFISNFIPFFIFIILSFLLNFIFCACSCYDYCPIICRVSDENRPMLKTMSLICYAFLAVNIFIPAYIGIDKF